MKKRNLELSIHKFSNPSFNPQQFGVESNSTKSKDRYIQAVYNQQRTKSNSITSYPQTKVDIAKISQDIASKLGKATDSQQQEFSKINNKYKTGNCNPLLNFAPPILINGNGDNSSKVSSPIGICASPKVDKLKTLRSIKISSSKRNSLNEKELKINSKVSDDNYFSFESKTISKESPKNEMIGKSSPSASDKILKCSNKYKLKQEDELSNQIASSISTYLKQRLATQSGGTNRNLPSNCNLEVFARKSSQGFNVCPKSPYQSNKLTKCSELFKQKFQKSEKSKKGIEDKRQEIRNSALNYSSKLLDKQNKLKRDTFIGSYNNNKVHNVDIDNELFTRESMLDHRCFQFLRLVRRSDSWTDADMISDICKGYNAEDLETLQLNGKRARYFSQDSKQDHRLFAEELSNISNNDDLFKQMVVEELGHGERLTISPVDPKADTTLVLASEQLGNDKYNNHNHSYSSFVQNRVPASTADNKSFSQSLFNDYSFLTIHMQDSKLEH